MQTEEKEMTENEKKKEYLRQYRIHVRRIHRINAEIAELRSMKISPSMNNDGMPHGSSQGDLSGYAAELDRMVSKGCGARMRKTCCFTGISVGWIGGRLQRR